jgi:cell division protein FtsI/penicillin-binding protein 2
MWLLLLAMSWLFPGAYAGDSLLRISAVSAPLFQSGSKQRPSSVLLDWKSGKVLAVGGQAVKATPGSVLKPLLLSYALQYGIVSATTRVYCRRTLLVAGHSLNCVHPDDRPLLDAEGALAESCNTWFASLARRMTAEDLQAVLRQAGLAHEASRLQDPDVRVLTALGLENVSATPMQIAAAYRALFLREASGSTVWNGLRDSVVFGMARNARIESTPVLGKTGTATNPGEWWTHGWFAGGVPGKYVLVVYVPRGDGGTAAALAGAELRRLLRPGAP